MAAEDGGRLRGELMGHVDTSDLLDGLGDDARRDRVDLISWLTDRGFSVEQIRASLAPMLLPANRVMGDDGVRVSARQICEETGVGLELLQRLQRAAGLPGIDDPDAATLSRADAEAVASAKHMVDLGIDLDEALMIVKVLTLGLSRAVAVMRESGFPLLIRPGASEVELAQAAEVFARTATPATVTVVESLLRLQLRRMFEVEGIDAGERAAGRLRGARPVAVAFADIAGFTRLGEALPPEELTQIWNRLANLAIDIAVPPVSFVKTVGDAAMFVSPDVVALIDTVLEFVGVAAANGVPQLRAGVAAGLAVSRAGDWFGSPVNVASRITGLARLGTVLVAESAREAGSASARFRWSSQGAHQLRGLHGEMELFRVDRRSKEAFE